MESKHGSGSVAVKSTDPPAKRRAMLKITPHMRILVAIERVANRPPGSPMPWRPQRRSVPRNGFRFSQSSGYGYQGVGR